VVVSRSSDRRISVVFALVLASALCGALLLYRVQRTGASSYEFLAWNLVLAWVPFAAALALYDANRRGRAALPQLALAALWLLFLPNAPYIVTDFVHVGEIGGAPIWFDAALVATFAGTGVVLGLGSVILVQAVVARTAGEVWGWLLLAPILALCSAGIVLGRVYRLNSWDALVQPDRLARVVTDRVADPAGILHGAFVLGAITGCLAVAYLVLYSVAGLAPERNRR
jgi:uncharacterized membrane protein